MDLILKQSPSSTDAALSPLSFSPLKATPRPLFHQHHRPPQRPAALKLPLKSGSRGEPCVKSEVNFTLEISIYSLCDPEPDTPSHATQTKERVARLAEEASEDGYSP